MGLERLLNRQWSWNEMQKNEPTTGGGQKRDGVVGERVIAEPPTPPQEAALNGAVVESAESGDGQVISAEVDGVGVSRVDVEPVVDPSHSLESGEEHVPDEGDEKMIDHVDANTVEVTQVPIESSMDVEVVGVNGVVEPDDNMRDAEGDAVVETSAEVGSERSGIDEVLDVVHQSRETVDRLVTTRDRGRRARDVWAAVPLQPEEAIGELEDAARDMGLDGISDLPGVMAEGTRAEAELETRGMYVAHAMAEAELHRSREVETALNEKINALHQQLAENQHVLLENGVDWRDQIRIMREVFETAAEVRRDMEQFRQVTSYATETIRHIQGEAPNNEYRNENHMELDRAATNLDVYANSRLEAMRTEFESKEGVSEEQTQRILTEKVASLGIAQDDEMLAEMGVRRVFDANEVPEGQTGVSQVRYEITDQWSNFASIVRHEAVRENADNHIRDAIENRPEESIAVCYLINDRMRMDHLARQTDNYLQEQVMDIRARRELERAMENVDNRNMLQRVNQFIQDNRPRQLQRRMFNAVANFATRKVSEIDANINANE